MLDEDKIPTNLRLLRVLEVLSNADGPMTPTEIGQALDMPKPTIHRLCKTLVEERYLVKDGNAKGLRPGRRTRAMAAGLMHSSSIHAARHQILIHVAREVGETVNFVVPEDQGMIYLDRVETDWAFQVKLPVGSHVPFHCTASGKTYLASLPKSARIAMVNAIDLDRHTPKTHTTPETLLDDLRQIRRQGYAIDDEEFMEDMVAIAVPVLDDKGRYAASLAFHGPCPRLSIQSIIAKKDVLLEASARLGKSLFAGDGG